MLYITYYIYFYYNNMSDYVLDTVVITIENKSIYD